jgi:hypothetical protein
MEYPDSGTGDPQRELFIPLSWIRYKESRQLGYRYLLVLQYKADDGDIIRTDSIQWKKLQCTYKSMVAIKYFRGLQILQMFYTTHADQSKHSSPRHSESFVNDI